MALSRAQLLAGDVSVVLPGQPQGVIAGSGIAISNTGVISVDSSTATGLVKLNDPLGYNDYTWPQIPGVSGQFLQTSGASGVLTWADAKGFAVVTVQPQPAPSPTDDGELWFDCSTGTLKIYQTCVAPGGWTDVNHSGLPVDPLQTTSSVPWTGSGTTADPYVMSVTAVGSGSTVSIENIVTVTGLAPYQYVPIVDLNAVANGGRFTFSNYYADASGTLTFQTIFIDQPPSLVSASYTANIRVGYSSVYIDAAVSITVPLEVADGVISGTPTVGTAVDYTPGIPAGGVSPYTTTYRWYANVSPISGATSSSYTPVAGDVGKTLSVVQTVTDASGAVVNSTVTAGSETVYPPIPDWSPSGSLDNASGSLSGNYTGPGTTMTASGCIEVSINGGDYGSGGPVNTGEVISIRWSSSLACGGAPTPTLIQGSLTGDGGQNDYSITISRVPNPPVEDIYDYSAPLGATVTQGIAAPISGLTATAFVTYDSSSTGTDIRASLSPIGPFTSLSTSDRGFAIANGQTLYIEQTVGVSPGVGYTAVIRIGDGTNDPGTYGEFVYTAATVSDASFPYTVFSSPASAPNATPDTVSIPVSVEYIALEGTAVTDANGWLDGDGVNLTATNMLLSVNGASFASSVTINVGDSLAVAWDPTYISGIATGTVATGNFASSPYVNSYQYFVDKNPDFTLPAPPPDPSATSVTIGGTVGTGVLAVEKFNSPIDVTISSVTTGTAIDLTNISYEIDTNGQVSVASLPHTFTLNPGENVQFFGDTGTLTTQEYGYTVTMGAAPAQEWLVETADTPPSIATPAIELPLGNATDVDPGLNNPSAIVIEGSTYDPQNGAGAQTSGTFELYYGNVSYIETSAIVSVEGNPLYSPSMTGSGGLGWEAGGPADAFLGSGKIAVYRNYGDSNSAVVTWVVPAGVSGTLGTEFIAGNTEVKLNGVVVAHPPGNVFNFTIADVVPGDTLEWRRLSKGAHIYIGNIFTPLGAQIPYGLTVTFADSTGLPLMRVGDTVEVVGSDGTGTIYGFSGYIGGAGYTLPPGIIVYPFSGSWPVGSIVRDVTQSGISWGDVPTTDPPDPAHFTAAPNSPYASTTPTPPTKPSATVLEADLGTSLNYFTRVKYSTTSPSNIDSNYSEWSKFTTKSSFTP